MSERLYRAKETIRSWTNIHQPNGLPNVFIFSAPRGGSTWLMEVIRTQPGFKSCSEPLYLQNPDVKRHLSIDDWHTLYQNDALPTLHHYFDAFCRGKLGYMNANPRSPHYRLFTQRIVFKILHGGEGHINWFRDQFNGRIVVMIRHPMAVTVSSEIHPRLSAFLESDYAEHFSAEQLAECRHIMDSGDELEKGTLSWCLQNAVPLWQATPDWSIVTYEQLVLDPEPVLQQLAITLELPRVDWMLDRLRVPSTSQTKSDLETQRMLETKCQQNRHQLIRKWRRKISALDERRAMHILEIFALDIYRSDELLPNRRLWHGEDYEHVYESMADKRGVQVRA
ncbi:sulfotransferase [Chloroflexi bacterium TSY]|nr:sulfotransferase [Chloroflexi bacterium TSY]